MRKQDSSGQPATKKDVQLVKQDLHQEIQIVKQELKHDIKDLESRIDEKISHLPTKDDFYSKMDEVMGELGTIREEFTLTSGRVSEHSDTLENHEDRIHKLEHPLAS